MFEFKAIKYTRVAIVPYDDHIQINIFVKDGDQYRTESFICVKMKYMIKKIKELDVPPVIVFIPYWSSDKLKQRLKKHNISYMYMED